MSAAQSVVARDVPSSQAYAWYVVFVLMLCQILSSIDAHLPFILVESLKRDLNLSDMQIGLITGPAFSLTYAICAIPIARLSDRGSRIAIIGAAVTVWSGFTALAGVAKGFGLFAFARIGVAVGEAALTPAAHAIIASCLHGAARAKGLAIYSVGTAIGAFLAFALGGHISETLGWRAAFLLIGGSGLLLVVLLLTTVRAPQREVRAGTAPMPRGDLRALFRNPLIRHVVVAGTLLGFSAGALNAWGPAYVMRNFDMSESEAGTSYGAVAGSLAFVGILSGGFVSSWLSERDPRYGLRMLSVAFPIAMAAEIAALLTGSYGVFLGMLAITVLMSSCYLGPTFAAVQSVADPGARSFASAVVLFSINGIGVASGSFVVGLISDMLAPWAAGDSLKFALLGVTWLKAWSAVHYWLASRNLARATA